MDYDTLNAIESNMKEVNSIVKKLQKSVFGGAVKMIMYMNLVMFVLNLMMLKKW